MANDPINPSHYRGIFKLKDNETIAVTRQLDFDLGCYYKYLARLYKKDDPVQDFHKARWYAVDWIQHHYPSIPDGPLFNSNAEKAAIAFDFIKAPDFGTELWDRWHLLRVVTQPFINGSVWIGILNEYENKYLADKKEN